MPIAFNCFLSFTWIQPSWAFVPTSSTKMVTKDLHVEPAVNHQSYFIWPSNIYSVDRPSSSQCCPLPLPLPSGTAHFWFSLYLTDLPSVSFVGYPSSCWQCNASRPKWNRRKGGRAQPLKEWHSLWGYDIYWLEPTRSKILEDSTPGRPWASLYTHCNGLPYAKWHPHRNDDSSEADHKRPKSGWWPNSWKSLPLPQNSWNNPPTY